MVGSSVSPASHISKSDSNPTSCLHHSSTFLVWSTFSTISGEEPECDSEFSTEISITKEKHMCNALEPNITLQQWWSWPFSLHCSQWAIEETQPVGYFLSESIVFWLRVLLFSPLCQKGGAGTYSSPIMRCCPCPPWHTNPSGLRSGSNQSWVCPPRWRVTNFLSDFYLYPRWESELHRQSLFHFWGCF